MSYAVDGMNEVLHHTDITATFVRDVLDRRAAAPSSSSTLGAATLRRRTRLTVGTPGDRTGDAPGHRTHGAPPVRGWHGNGRRPHAPGGEPP